MSTKDSAQPDGSPCTVEWTSLSFDTLESVALIRLLANRSICNLFAFAIIYFFVKT